MEKTRYAVVGTKLSTGVYISTIATNWLDKKKEYYYYPPEKMSKKEAARALEKKIEASSTWDKYSIYKIYKYGIKRLDEAEALTKYYFQHSENESSGVEEVAREKRKPSRYCSSRESSVFSDESPAKSKKSKLLSSNIPRGRAIIQSSDEESDDLEKALNESISSLLPAHLHSNQLACTVPPSPPYTSGILTQNSQLGRTPPRSPCVSTQTQLHSGSVSAHSSSLPTTPPSVRRTAQSVRRTPQLVRRTPESVCRTPQSVRRTPKSVCRTPKSVCRTPQSVCRTPQSVCRTPQSVRRTPQSVCRTPQSVHHTSTKTDCSSSFSDKELKKLRPFIRECIDKSVRQILPEVFNDEWSAYFIENVRLTLTNVHQEEKSSESVIVTHEPQPTTMFRCDLLPLSTLEAYFEFEHSLTNSHFAVKLGRFLKHLRQPKLKQTINLMISRTIGPGVVCIINITGSNEKINFSESHIFKAISNTVAELFPYCPAADIRKQISLKVIQFANTVKTRKKSVFEEAQAALEGWRKSSHGDEASVGTHEELSVNPHEGKVDPHEESSVNPHEGTVDPHEGVSVNPHEGVSGNPPEESSCNPHLERVSVINPCE